MYDNERTPRWQHIKHHIRGSEVPALVAFSAPAAFVFGLVIPIRLIPSYAVVALATNGVRFNRPTSQPRYYPEMQQLRASTA